MGIFDLKFPPDQLMVVELRFLIYATIECTSYFYYSVLLERLLKDKYVIHIIDEFGDIVQIPEKFQFSYTYVFIVSGCTFLLGNLQISLHPPRPDKTPDYFYAFIAISHFIGSIFSNLALEHISYPTHLIARSAKPISIMMSGLIVNKHPHQNNPIDFSRVILIVLGIGLFMWNNNDESDPLDKLIGQFYLFLTFILDGFSGALQEMMRQNYKPSGRDMMVGINKYSTIYSFILTVLSMELVEFTFFVIRHSVIFQKLILLGMTAGIGQLAVLHLIAAYGSLAASLATTVRRFITVFYSVIFVGHKLNEIQLIGCILVFSGLFVDLIFTPSNPPTRGPSRRHHHTSRGSLRFTYHLCVK